MSQSATTSNFTGVDSTTGYYVNGVQVITSGGSEVLVDLTTTGNTLLGNGGADTTTITSASATALTAGQNGATNPAFNVDASTGTSRTGINIKSGAAAGGVAVSVLSSGTDESVTLNAKGAGVITLGNISTGGVVAGLAAATTTTQFAVTGTGLTSGVALKLNATQGTLTTGRYLSAYDAATEVFGIGCNGHLISTVSAVAPSCLITAAHGITAATITAGSTDTCGIITTTGTQDNATDSTFTITFGKTYTAAPKSVTLTAANSAGAVGSSLPYIVSISPTALVIGVTKSASSAATPSWYYQIIG